MDGRIEHLQEARACVQKEVDRFGASPILGFSKIKFFFGVSKTYLSVYVFGKFPHLFWGWHCCQFWILMPVHMYRWWHMKYLLYFAELCWVTNLGTTSVLALSYLRPALVGSETLSTLTSVAFAFAAGPLAFAAIAFGNALVPHSIDHTMSLLIHLQPLMTSYSLRWFPWKEQEGVLDLSFWDYYRPVLKCLGAYAICHAGFFMSFGLGLAAKGHRSSPTDQLKPRRPTMMSKLFGEFGSGGSDSIRFLKYETAMFTQVAAVTALTYPLYVWGTKAVHFGFIVVTCLSSVWHGATWYEYNLKRMTASIDRLIDEAKKGD